MVKSIWIFLVLGLTMVSCHRKQEDKIPHQVLFFRDNSIKMQQDTIPVSFKHAIENGEYTLNDERGLVISQGKVDAGFRVGSWIYKPTDSTNIGIDWAKYVNSIGKVALNYPRGWAVIDDPERPFQARFPLKENETDKGKYFIILSHSTDSMDLDGYQRYYKSQMFSSEEIKEYAHFVFNTMAGKKFYFMRYVIQRGKEELSIFTFIGDRGSKIYDITYSSSNESIEEKHITFFEIVRSFRLDGDWFFSPYDPVTNFERFEFKDRTKPNA